MSLFLTLLSTGMLPAIAATSMVEEGAWATSGTLCGFFFVGVAFKLSANQSYHAEKSSVHSRDGLQWNQAKLLLSPVQHAVKKYCNPTQE